MFVEYFYWHYVLAPRWLAHLFWNLEHALLRFFSVGFLVRTLFAPWRRDSTPYRGSIGKLAFIFAWNQISRLIGAIIRLSVLVVWVVAQCVLLGLALIFWAIFLIWPLVVIISLAAGLALILIN